MDLRRAAMSAGEEWAYTEQHLPQVASTMGQILMQIRPHVAAGLVDGAGWDCLLERAHEAPATLAAFPFGFEIPLQDPQPRVDFGVSLVGASRTAAHYQARSRAPDADPTTRRLAWLLDETDREDSLLRRVVGRKVLLEYDIDTASGSARPDSEQDRAETGTAPGDDPDSGGAHPATGTVPGGDSDSGGAHPDPGIFLYPPDDVLAGGGQRFRELGAVHDALVFAGGWRPDAAERRQLERFYRTLKPDTLIRALGTFPSRERTMRIAVTGFRTARGVVECLERAGWPGRPSTVADVVSFFEKRKAFAYLGVHFDITASGVGPALGLSFFAREKEWLKGIGHWTALIDGIGEQGYAVEEKLAALARRSTGSAMLFARPGPIMLVRGIHHIKLAIAGEQVEQVKAYNFFLMMFARPGSAPTSR